MVKNFDHVAIVVRDIDAAKKFFGLLGFEEDKSVVISGELMANYMGVDGIEADHVTLVLKGVAPRTEVQLVKYHHPDPVADPNITNLAKLGFNHICFAVDDIEARLDELIANGFEPRNKIMDYHDRKLIFLVGPEGITVELAEWH